MKQCGNNPLSKCTLGRLDISTGQTGRVQRPLRKGLLEDDLQIQDKDSNAKATTAVLLLKPHHECPFCHFFLERNVADITYDIQHNWPLPHLCVLCGITLTMTSTVTGTVLLRDGLPPSLAITLKRIIPLGTCS